jgi:hypothetical protein
VLYLLQNLIATRMRKEAREKRESKHLNDY